MQYISTRDREQQFSAAQAISKGLADDGGLLTPVYLPKLPRRSLEELKDMSYQQRAVYVMKLFLDGFSVKEICHILKKNEKQVSPDVRIRADQFYKKHVSLQQGCMPIAEPSGDLRMS